jgi:hypothetical protein
MGDEESLYEHTLPTATAFLEGSYDLESVVHGFYSCSTAAAVRAWADAVVAAVSVRVTVAAELKLAARMYTRTYYGTHDRTPATATRAFEVFAYGLMERVLQKDSSKVELVLDLVGALHEAIVVPAETPTLGILVCLETSKHSIVYFRSNDSSLPAWGLVLVEALARRVLEDECAFEHARFSEPSRVVFQRCAYATKSRSLAVGALMQRIGLENAKFQRGVRNTQLSDCLVRRHFYSTPATPPTLRSPLGRRKL